MTVGFRFQNHLLKTKLAIPYSPMELNITADSSQLKLSSVSVVAWLLTLINHLFSKAFQDYLNKVNFYFDSFWHDWLNDLGMTELGFFFNSIF